MDGKDILSDRAFCTQTRQDKFNLIGCLSLSLIFWSNSPSGLCSIDTNSAKNSGTSKNIEQTKNASQSGAAEDKTSKTEFAKGQIYTKSLGLSPADLHLVNQGRFVELVNKLSAKTGLGKITRQSAWLAFSYLYLQKCDDLNSLAKTCTENTSDDADINLTLIKSFAFLCDKKLDLAEKEMQKIPAEAMQDAFINYAFATLSGKQGKAQAAISYTKRAVEIAPDFAWGYRTMAFLQDKWLHQSSEAKKNYANALAIEPKLIEASSALINLSIANNDYDQAIAIAKEAIANNPRKSSVYCQLADIYIQQWRLHEAAQQLKKAVSIEPGNTQYYRQLSFILEKEGQLETAIGAQKKAVEHSLDKSADLVRLATLQLEYGQKDQAVATLKDSIEVNPQNIIAISNLTNLSIEMGTFDDLLGELNKCSAKYPKNEVIKIHLGDAYAAAKQIDKAIESYKEAANLNATDADPHTKIAALLIAKKDFEGAAKEYTRALNISPNSSANLVALGSCEALMDDYLKAEAAFVTALALHQLTQSIDSTLPPTRVDIIRGLAALLYKEGRYADAAAQFMAVIEMDKTTTNAGLDKFMSAQAISLRDLSQENFKQLDAAYNNLSSDEKIGQRINYIDTLLRGKRYDEALSFLQGEIFQTKDPRVLAIVESPFHWICLSRAYLNKGNLEQAEQAAQKALEICEKEKSPKSDAYCQLGEVLYIKGDLIAAEKNADSAIGINIRAFRAYVLLGNIAMKQKQYKLAVEGANKALEIDPYYIDAYLLLGAAQTAQGDNKGALTTYTKAVDLYPALVATHESLLAVLNKVGTKEEIAREQATIDSLKSKQ